MSKKIIVAKTKPDNLNRMGREGKRGGEACKGREGESRWAPWEWGCASQRMQSRMKKAGYATIDRFLDERTEIDR